jgi:group I intron endonuclease
MSEDVISEADVKWSVKGVYRIRNTLNDKVYIGSAAYSVRRRWRDHRRDLRAGKHCQHGRCHLQHAWNKYGEECFVFELIEEAEPKLCVPGEQYWLDHYRAADDRYGYNESPTAGSILGFKLSEEAKKKMRAFQRQLESRALRSGQQKARWAAMSPEDQAQNGKRLRETCNTEAARYKRKRGSILHSLNGWIITRRALNVIKRDRQRGRRGSRFV